MVNAYARVIAGRHDIPLRLHQLQTANFPLRFAARLNPYRVIALPHELLGNEGQNRAVLASIPGQLAAYESATRSTVDYILIEGTASAANAAIARSLENELALHYTIKAAETALPGFVLLERTAPKSH